MGMSSRTLLCLASGLLSLPLAAKVHPNPLFSDHTVLQAGRAIPVWGTADEGERITVSLAGQQVKTVAHQGKWKVVLPARKAGGPFVLRIAGTNVIEAKDVLVGEVWLASGQSNMERQLGLRPPQLPLRGWEAAAAGANFSSIREFHVDQRRSISEQNEPTGHWEVCTPSSAEQFSAVGFFFARSLWQQRHVPVGMIHSSWGGTPAEAWVSEAGLEAQPDFKAQVAQTRLARQNPTEAETTFQKAWVSWYQAYDPGERQQWMAPELDETGWDTQSVPGLWEEAGLPNFDGIVWYRRSVEVPTEWVNQDTELHIGAVDDIDTTWVNGHRVGAGEGWNTPRIYRVPAGTLKPGHNVIAVRVVDTGGGGGMVRVEGKLRLDLPTKGSLELDGPWRRKVATPLSATGPVPVNPNSTSPVYPGALYNAMIAPLVPYAMRGVIWYQGESNVNREAQYRTLFPSLIADWRRVWGQGSFPFLFVQIAPFATNSPELREAQLLSLKATPQTAMAVTLDVGDANDIHPTDKAPVGERLALAARALAYGEKVEYSGPVFEKAELRGGSFILHFTHLGGGLVAPGGALKGFTLVDADGKSHPAQARIEGESIVVSSSEVPAPKAARYAWASAPEGNLFNRAGLPASPFRTDQP